LWKIIPKLRIVAKFVTVDIQTIFHIEGIDVFMTSPCHILKGGSYLYLPIRGFELHGDWCTVSCEVHTNFADESIRLLADDVRNEVVTIHRSQEVLKMLSSYMQTFLAPVEEVLLYLFKLFCRNICNLSMNIFFYFSVLRLLL
jgi:hypothetical protein